MGSSYCAAVGHVTADHSQRSAAGLISACLQLAHDMLEVRTFACLRARQLDDSTLGCMRACVRACRLPALCTTPTR